MTQPGRQYAILGDSAYRFAFNGKLLDNNIYRKDNSYDYGARFYDPRLARFLSRDPLEEKYAEISPYAFCNDNPIIFIDPEGKDLVKITVPANSSGTKTKQVTVDKNVAQKMYNFAWAAQKKCGYTIVHDNAFRSVEKQAGMRKEYDDYKKAHPNAKSVPGYNHQPASTSAHIAGMALDLDVPKSVTPEELDKINNLAKEYDFQQLATSKDGKPKDRGHYFLDEKKNGYKSRAEAIKVNDKYLKDHPNVPDYKGGQEKAKSEGSSDTKTSSKRESGTDVMRP